MNSQEFQNKELKTAVLFLVFNRPDTTKQVFEAIRQAKPPRLYVAADGPREGKLGEVELVEKVRTIATAVDWPCEVKTLFREENLGCKYAVSGAITWFFEQEEQGIILEDDCLPNQDFFHFSEVNLKKYKNDRRVMMISGTNYLSSTNTKMPYFFSEHYTIWGWATWRRAWQLYDVEMADWGPEFDIKFLKKKYKYHYIYKHFQNTFNALKKDYVDTWDIQWVFTCLSNHGLCVTPSVNMISNIGVNGTHWIGLTDSHFIPTLDLKLSQHANVYPKVRINYEYDITLHELKSKKAVRIASVAKGLKAIGLFNIAMFIRDIYLGLRRRSW